MYCTELCLPCIHVPRPYTGPCTPCIDIHRYCTGLATCYIDSPDHHIGSRGCCIDISLICIGAFSKNDLQVVPFQFAGQTNTFRSYCPFLVGFCRNPLANKPLTCAESFIEHPFLALRELSKRIQKMVYVAFS